MPERWPSSELTVEFQKPFRRLTHLLLTWKGFHWGLTLFIFHKSCAPQLLYLSIGPLYLLSSMSFPQWALRVKGLILSASKGTSSSVKLSPSLQTPQCITKAQTNTMRGAVDFHCKFPTETKAEVANMEHAIKRKRWKLPKEQLEAEFKEWVPDSSYSRTRDTKIFKLIELYWLNKAFITQVVEEKSSQQQAMMQKLNMMDQKFDALCKSFLIFRSQSTAMQRPRTTQWMKQTRSQLLKVLPQIPFC